MRAVLISWPPPTTKCTYGKPCSICPLMTITLQPVGAPYNLFFLLFCSESLLLLLLPCPSHTSFALVTCILQTTVSIFIPFILVLFLFPSSSVSSPSFREPKPCTVPWHIIYAFRQLQRTQSVKCSIIISHNSLASRFVFIRAVPTCSLNAKKKK